MREYTVEQTSLTFKWTYKRMLPFVPTPGTQPFAALCKGLAQYDLDPSRITVDAPTSRFGDLTLGIGLVGNRVALKFSPGFLELYVNNLYVDDEKILVDIANVVFAALKEVDPDSAQGEAHVRSASHLKLAPLENVAVLHEHLKTSTTISEFIPEAAVYRLDLGKQTRAKELRFVIAKSIAYEDALFFDFNGLYDGPIDPVEFAKQVDADFNLVAEKIGLKEKLES